MSGPPPPGQQPSPQQMAAIQQQIAAEAQRRGMTPQQLQAQQRQQIQAEADKAGLTFEQYINKLKQQAFENHQRQQQMAQQQAQNQAAQPQGQPQGQPQMQGQQGQQVPITPGAPDPRAVALAKWLKGQDLKPRTCILNGQRKDMFRGTSSPSPFLARIYEVTEALEQSNEPSEPLTPPPTRKPAAKTPSSPRSPPQLQKPKYSNCSRSPCSLYVFQNLIPTKAMAMLLRSLRSESRGYGPSRSNSSRI